MAITNAQAVKFGNETVRPQLDRIAQAYNAACAIIDEWYAQDMASNIPNDVGELLMDGSDTDGRPVMTGADVTNVITWLISFRDGLEANGNASLNVILSGAVNTLPG